MLSIIIPSRTEKFLNKTIQDVLDKSTGEIEVFPVLDGYGDTPYEPIIDKRVKYLSLPNNNQRQKRMAVNAAVSISKGKYVMWLDAHCCIAKGFDEILAKDCQDDWVVVPRRYKIDPQTWDRTADEKGRPPVDYEYFMWRHLIEHKRIAGYRWSEKSLAKKDILIDDIFTAQGSLFFMTRKHFDRMRFMRIEGFTGWGQEGEEICLTTLLNGGRAVVNKNIWYAHLHKGQMHGRMYKWINARDSYDYSYNYWVHERRDFFISVIERFGLFPNWKPNWKDIIYNGHVKAYSG